MATETNGATATATKLKPLGDRVVVKPPAREETTKSGIVLPDTAKEKPQRGDSRRRRQRAASTTTASAIELDVKVGDTVLFAKYGGTEFKLEDEELLILSEKDILAIIED